MLVEILQTCRPQTVTQKRYVKVSGCVPKETGGMQKRLKGFRALRVQVLVFGFWGSPSLPNSLTWDRLCWTFVRNSMANTVAGSLRQGACSGLFRIDG